MRNCPVSPRRLDLNRTYPDQILAGSTAASSPPQPAQERDEWLGLRKCWGRTQGPRFCLNVSFPLARVKTSWDSNSHNQYWLGELVSHVVLAQWEGAVRTKARSLGLSPALPQSQPLISLWSGLRGTTCSRAACQYLIWMGFCKPGLDKNN